MILWGEKKLDKKAKLIWKTYTKGLYKAVDDSTLQTGLRRTVDSYRKGVKKTLSRYPETIEIAKEVRKIKEESIKKNKELFNLAKEKLEENGFKVILAKTKEDALKKISQIVDGAKLVIKSKSMVSEEIGLREFLESRGIEVWETDLGELLIQLANSRPMHIVTPSLHIPREKAAELLGRLIGREINKDDIPAMVKAAREFLREKYFKADVGVTGANVVAAKEGAIVIIENEGNARLTMGLPPKHIIITGIEKIVPTLTDAVKVALVTWRNAKYPVTSYLNIVSGPNNKQTLIDDFRPVIGPRESYIIFIDNGRSEMVRDPIFREASYCLRCGACIYECTAFNLVAGYFGGRTYMSGIGTIWTAFTEGIGKAAPAAYTCLLDGRCKVVCPINIDIPNMILHLRERITSLNA